MPESDTPRNEDDFRQCWRNAKVNPKIHETLYQVSTLQALVEGVVDGEVTLAEVRKHGDIGIGTFEGIDGEMVYLDGAVYQIDQEGAVREMPDETRTPFAVTAFFEPDRTLDLEPGMDFERFKTFLDEKLPTTNIPMAVLATGRFRLVKTRSGSGRAIGNRRLSAVARAQHVFEYADTEGTLVGFRIPPFLQTINMPGYHLHYLDDSRTGGGHVLDFVVEAAECRLDLLPHMGLVLPETEEFGEADLASDKSDAIHDAET